MSLKPIQGMNGAFDEAPKGANVRKYEQIREEQNARAATEKTDPKGMGWRAREERAAREAAKK